ncbi:MAG: hypothetical protein ACOC8L_01010 [Spirochaetota bacterium]
MISDAAAARLARLPHIKRARGFRLYAPKERRILDLYQDGGRAMLGHRPGKLVHDVKNVLERGVLSPFPSPEPDRVRKIVASLLEQTMPRDVWAKPFTYEHVLLYPTVESALDAVRATGTSPRVWDPVAVSPTAGRGGAGVTVAGGHRAGGEATREVWLWRPELPEAVWAGHGVQRARAVIVLLPLPSAFSVIPLLLQAAATRPAPPLPEPSLRAATLVAHMTVRLEARPEPAVPGFRSTGPYLTMADVDHIDEATYEQRFLRFLEHDILISPDSSYPSIYPREMSEGEQKKLERVSLEIIGGQRGE